MIMYKRASQRREKCSEMGKSTVMVSGRGTINANPSKYPVFWKNKRRRDSAGKKTEENQKEFTKETEACMSY